MRAVRVAAAVLIAALTLAASVTGLWHVASETARMGVLGSVAIVAGFDVTAVLVGLRLVERPGWKSWLGLAGLAALSAAAQIAASDAALGWWRLLHGAPSVVAIWTLHGAVGEFGTPQLKAQAPTVRRETKKNQGARNAARSTSSAVAKSAPATTPPGEVPTGDGSPSLIGRERGHRPSATGAPSGGPTVKGAASPCRGDALFRAVALWLAEQERPLAKRSVEEAVRSINGTCSRTTRDAVYDALAATDALDLWATSVAPHPKDS